MVVSFVGSLVVGSQVVGNLVVGSQVVGSQVVGSLFMGGRAFPQFSFVGVDFQVVCRHPLRDVSQTGQRLVLLPVIKVSPVLKPGS